MSDEIIKKLAHIFSNQQKMLEKLAQDPNPEQSAQNHALNNILVEVAAMRNSIKSNTEMSDETKKHYIHWLSVIHDNISALHE